MKSAVIIVLVVFLIYIIFCFWVYFYQEKFIFHPQKGSYPPPEDLDIEEHWVNTSNGVKLHAWWMKVDPKAYTVLYFHGNAVNISAGEKRMRLFREMGFNALAIEYRGYGASTGKIKKESEVYQDALAAYDFLIKDLEINENTIIIWGWSLGGAVAVDLAQHKNCKALIMESSFYSLQDIAQKVFWFIPIRWLSRYDFLSYDKLSQIKCPVIFVHSKTDETVPYSHGERLYNKFTGTKKFIEIRGDHNHGIFDSMEKFIPEAGNFLKQTIKP